MNKISIIIPVYNVEPYLKKCLNSVINQTYSNLEIICVNDGSTDNSGKICDEYAAKDNRIKVFHQENKGLSFALNIGLKNFTGDYLGFVDSDDWIELNMYETLFNTIKQNKTDICVASYFLETDNKSIPMNNKKQIPGNVIETKDMLLYPMQRDYYMSFCGYIWNKLYTADVVIKSNLLFDNNIKYGMDVLFFTNIVLKQKCKGFYVNKPLYHYLQRNTAISKTKLINIKSDILSVYKQIEKLLNKNGYSDISFWARGFYCYHASVIAEIAFANNEEKQFRFMQNEIKKYLNDYIETNKEFPEKFERMYKLCKI